MNKAHLGQEASWANGFCLWVSTYLALDGRVLKDGGTTITMMLSHASAIWTIARQPPAFIPRSSAPRAHPHDQCVEMPFSFFSALAGLDAATTPTPFGVLVGMDSPRGNF